MPQEIVVAIGDLPFEHFDLDCLVRQFGWSLETVPGIGHLKRLRANHSVAAVLFNPGLLELPWERALQSVLDATPRALPVLCHDFAEKIDWQQAADAGAFHSLLMPFDEVEVKQCLGFIWAAKRRKQPIVIRRRQRARSAAAGESQRHVSDVVA